MIPVLSQLGSSRILGIDISGNAVAEAKQAYGGLADFCMMDGHRMALADESLDVVVGGAILHHLDFRVAIREIHRVLKPGGRAIFTEPLRDNPAARLILFCPLIPLATPPYRGHLAGRRTPA